MDRMPNPQIKVGEWLVDPMACTIARGTEVERVDARTMRLLVYLAARPGQVVSIDELLREVLSGVIVTSDSVYQAVTSLRRALGDDTRQPTYIATVPRRGYRMVASVSVPANADTAATTTPATSTPRKRSRVPMMLGVAAIATAAFVAYHYYWKPTEPEHSAASMMPASIAQSVAVVPFLDLTAGMTHEYLADGITEEVIGRLSKLPKMRVVAPTTSFYIQGKPIAVTDIARNLGVTYVMDGSVRKSGSTLRVAVRLSRGVDGYVVWSASYDRRLGDMLSVQREIAIEIAKALSASLTNAVS